VSFSSSFALIFCHTRSSHKAQLSQKNSDRPFVDHCFLGHTVKIIHVYNNVYVQLR